MGRDGGVLRGPAGSGKTFVLPRAIPEGFGLCESIKTATRLSEALETALGSAVVKYNGERHGGFSGGSSKIASEPRF